MSLLSVRKGSTYPIGASLCDDGIQFSCVTGVNQDCGVVLIRRNDLSRVRIPFSEGRRVGNISSVVIKNIDYSDYRYNFYIGDREIPDPYARRIYGNEEFGIKESCELSCGFNFSDNSAGDFEPLCIPFSQSVIYCLHVRSFTADPSSKVSAPGTFSGITEKVQYLKKLGITAIEILPCYEFEETERLNENPVPGEYVAMDSVSFKLNYWGFKKGFYFAPKSSYSAGDPVAEFKTMVDTLHRNGIEVIMQFYFPDDVKQGFIFDVLKYWVSEYHIDGVHLKGSRIPITLICTEPLFANTKIFYDYIPEGEIYSPKDKPLYKNLCVYSDEFMYKVRGFLKGDEDRLKDFAYLSKYKPEHVGSVNFLTNYYGFTLNDLVSYDRKHNEDNGENNADGTNCNFSWNCGVEGPTRKTQINLLRKRMIKNALCMELLSQGTPVITAGDEFMNSQNGNNNPYCQDNEVNYLNWKFTKAGKEINDFTRMLIEFRKKSRLFEREVQPTMLDCTNSGFPDLSFHGEEAWKADFAGFNRHLGLMYAIPSEDESALELTYGAYNMYWEDKTFALPSLPKGSGWKLDFSTGKVECDCVENKCRVCLEKRSAAFFTVRLERNNKNNFRRH